MSADLLSLARVRNKLADPVAELWDQWWLMETVPSTNQFLLDAIAAGEVESGVCLAEQQSEGRGREGRTWVSPPGNIMFSFTWPKPNGPEAQALGLVTGLGVMQGIHMLAPSAHVKIRWPNDLVIGEGKVSGILIEGVSDPSGRQHLVIGVGINVRLPRRLEKQIDRPATDLVRWAGRIEREALIASVLQTTVNYLHRFEREGWSPFREEFARHDALYGVWVRIQQGYRTLMGQALGLNHEGALSLSTDAGIVSLWAGEVHRLSMLPNPSETVH